MKGPGVDLTSDAKPRSLNPTAGLHAQSNPVADSTTPAEHVPHQESSDSAQVADLLDGPERFHALLNHIPAALYACDARGQIVTYNEAAATLWGWRPPLGETRWCGSFKIFNPDGSELPHDACPMAIAIKEGRAIRAREIIVERPDGERRHVLANPEPLFNSAGVLIGAIKMMVDITDRKRAEAELAATKDDLAVQVTNLSHLHELALRLSHTPETAPALQAILETLVRVYAADFGLVSLFNPATGRRHAGASIGFEAGALEQLSAIQVDSAAVARANEFGLVQRVVIEDVDADERFEPIRDVAREAGFRSVHSTPIMTRSGEILGVLSVYFRTPRSPTEREMQLADVCARHAAEALEAGRARAALTASEQRFHHMADNVPVLIWVNGVDGCEFVNREYLRYTGRTHDELRGDAWQSILHPEDAEEYVRAYQDAVRLLGPFQAHARLRGANGVYRWFRSTGVPRLNPDGKSLGYVGCSFDISEIKRSEEALREAKEMAEAANESKDRFLAVLSHELRTPLTPVLMAASALEKNADLPSWVREDAQMISENIRLETRLIDDLLDLSRIASGKLQLLPEVTDLNDIVLHVCGMCRSHLEEKSLRLHCELDENVGEVVADPARLQQVFWNILKNAAKFTPNNGDIFVKTQRVDANRFRVAFRDTGMGMEPEALTRVFTAFEQGDQKITRRFGGLGLGLAIARALIELHGGSITAHSEGRGKGTLFIVEIPVRYAAGSISHALSKPLQFATDSQESLRLLVVEDDVVTAKVLARLLHDRGYAVQSADCMASALALVETETFDLIISDLSLPDGSGYDLMNALLRKRPTKAIAMSGFGAKQDIERSLEVGFSAHLVKPVDMSDLDTTIRQVCGRPR